MRYRRAFIPGAQALAAVLFLAACGESAPRNASSAAPNEIVLNRGNGAEAESLDPALADTTWEQWIIGDLMMGLFTEDAEGNPSYGAATNVLVSPDGLTWTFTLRDHLWSDGTKVTADDFVYAWQRTLDPKTTGKYGAILYAFKNARAIAEGKLPPTELGAKAPDEETIVLELEHPAPYMGELLTLNITYPVPRHVIVKIGAEWT